MVYKIELSRWGRYFSVPCSAADEYIKLADGDFVKALLCALCSNSVDVVDTDDIAARAGISPARAADAMLYWAQCGVLSLDGVQAVPAQSAVKTASSAKAQTEKPTKSEPAEKPKPKSDKRVTVKYLPSDLARLIEEDPKLSQLAHGIQEIFGRTINNTEVAGIINLCEYYSFSPAAVLMLAEYCHKLGKDSFAYVERVARDWFEKGIIDSSEIEAEIIRREEIFSYEKRVLKVLGMEKLSKNQKETVEQWHSLGYPIELIEIAADNCLDYTHKISISYINGILTNWSKAKITTPEQALEEKKHFKESNKSKYANDAAGGEKNKDASYDIDEFERFLLNGNHGADKRSEKK